jgi:hypothetical protein
LNNLSGSPALREIEQQLRVALAEKMIVDFDYLPLPDLGDNAGPAARPGGKGGRGKRGGK